MNKRTIPFVSLALLGGLTACNPSSITVTIDPTLMTYSRDARTNLCLGTMGRQSVSSNGNVSLSFTTTQVPCSPEVLALVPVAQRG